MSIIQNNTHIVRRSNNYYVTIDRHIIVTSTDINIHMKGNTPNSKSIGA